MVPRTHPDLRGAQLHNLPDGRGHVHNRDSTPIPLLQPSSARLHARWPVRKQQRALLQQIRRVGSRHPLHGSVVRRVRVPSPIPAPSDPLRGSRLPDHGRRRGGRRRRVRHFRRHGHVRGHPCPEDQEQRSDCTRWWNRHDFARRLGRRRSQGLETTSPHLTSSFSSEKDQLNRWTFVDEMNAKHIQTSPLLVLAIVEEYPTHSLSLLCSAHRPFIHFLSHSF